MVIQIPPGFRFRPTDQELISYFLKRKEKGLTVACDHIIEKEVYGNNSTPWKVFNEDQPWTDCDDTKKKMIFVFSKLSKVGNSNKKICRVAGCGTWEGKALSQNVKNLEGRIIGKKRTFTFKPKKGFEFQMKGKGHWIMHEMSVEGYNYVICRITKDLSKGFPNDHEKKEEEKISIAGKGLSYDDDDQQESYRMKRKLADQSEVEEEEDSPHGKKLCSGGDGDVPTVEQLLEIALEQQQEPVFQFPTCDDDDAGYEEPIIDLSFLFDDNDKEVHSNGSFDDAKRFTIYVQDLEDCNMLSRSRSRSIYI